MLLAKVKTAAAVLLAAAVLGGGGGVGVRVLRAGDGDVPGPSAAKESLREELRRAQARVAALEKALREQEKGPIGVGPRGGVDAKKAPSGMKGGDGSLASGPRRPTSDRDDVELLRAQVEVKQAELKAAKAAADRAKSRYARLAELRKSGAVTERLVDEAQADVEVAQAQLQIKEAELREALVRLRQAQRRAGERPPTKSMGGAPASAERRLDELEKKIQALQKELEALRKELKGARARPGPRRS
jgi:hypothetical protein